MMVSKRWVVLGGLPGHVMLVGVVHEMKAVAKVALLLPRNEMRGVAGSPFVGLVWCSLLECLGVSEDLVEMRRVLQRQWHRSARHATTSVMTRVVLQRLSADALRIFDGTAYWDNASACLPLPVEH